MIIESIKSKENDEEKMEKRADILFPSMKDKKKSKTSKKSLLGDSVFDDEIDEDKNQIKKGTKNLSDNNTKQDITKSRKERTLAETSEILDLMYPTMAKVNKAESAKGSKFDSKTSDKTTDNKKGHFTGGAAKMTEISDKNLKETDIKSEKERNSNTLKNLGMDDNKYQIKGNTISRKSDYDIVNGVKYPKNNEKAQEIKNDILNKKIEENTKEREKYLKSYASKPYQYAVDNVDKSFVKPFKNIKITREAVENLHMSKSDSYMNTDYAKKHKVYNNYKEAPEELKDYLKEKISKQIGEDKLESAKGIFIDRNSESSKSLSDNLIEDKDFIRKLKEYEKPMNHNFTVDDSISLKSENWHNAVGNADIKKMHINKDGDVELYITDTYDFNKDEKKGAPAVGRDRQEKGEIKPYFAIYHVVIPKEKYERLIQK